MKTTILLSLLFLISSIAHAKPPNVLFIAVDDLRPELGTYGTNIKSPNFDRLANSGMRFDRAYCQQAVCGASRLSIMGGLYPTLTREQTYHVDGWRKRHPGLLTLNQHFGAQGYRTVGLGKIYHGSSGHGVDPDNWQEWIKISAPGYANKESQAKMSAYNRKNKTSKRGPTTEGEDVPDDTFADGKRAREAVRLLKTFATEEKPFFLAVGFTKPHLPFVAPKKYWDLYDRKEFTMPPNAGIPPGYPEYAANQLAGEMRNYSDYEGKKPTDFSDELNQRLLHGYAACVSYVDACLGRVLRALKENGLEENTLVVLWGDHGWKLGDHSSWCKHTNFECDTRVPLMVRVPGKSTGKPCRQVVELIDLYPTLCELTGIPTPKHCQGKSFTALLKDPTAEHRETAYSSYPARDELGHSIRMGKYRYTEWWTKSGKRTDKRVLTDLLEDPGEVTNVIADPERAKVVKRAEKQLAQRIKDALN